MDLQCEIKKYLIKNDYKPNYLWCAQNYLNGFLVNLPGYNGATMQDFQRIMSDYCEMGYFKSENGIKGLPSFRLTQQGYQILLTK